MINFSIEIIHNNNILTNTITSRSTLKRNVINGSHSDMPLYVDYMNINDPLKQYVCGITNYSVHELHALNNIIRSSLNTDHLPALVSYLGHAKVIPRSRYMGVNTWLLIFDVT